MAIRVCNTTSRDSARQHVFDFGLMSFSVTNMIRNKSNDVQKNNEIIINQRVEIFLTFFFMNQMLKYKARESAGFLSGHLHGEK